MQASDIRASVCLVMAALAADGTTTIHNAHHLFRGYEDLIGKLAKCQVAIKIALKEQEPASAEILPTKKIAIVT